MLFSFDMLWFMFKALIGRSENFTLPTQQQQTDRVSDLLVIMVERLAAKEPDVSVRSW